ncbi:MAG: copper resistance CopC family protein [Pontibacterium sp.]
MKVWLKVVTLCFAVASSSLWAHGKMTTTVPADGSSVIEPLEQLELHFSRATKLVNVKLTSLTGKKVPVSVNRSLGAQTLFELSVPPLSAGKYQVEWKGLGADGHVMKGRFSFEQR